MQRINTTTTGSLAKNTSQKPAEPRELRIRSTQRRNRNLLIDLPIGARLTLGFIIAALIASAVAGAIGVQQSQSLSGQSNFYRQLLQSNTDLTTAANFLQLMDTETHNILNIVNSPQPSQDTLNTDKTAVQKLVDRYNKALTDYANKEILRKHADQVALLAKANREGQADQQATLTASTLRTWGIYRDSQSQILNYINNGQVAQATHLEQFNGEPTQADAVSALRALIRFNGRLANSVDEVASVEEQSQILLTIIGSTLAFIAILLIGWMISGTIVRRLTLLRNVTQAVERGQWNRRVSIVGRDEIADVSASVNAMLEAIVGLLDETRSQRDALTNAAEHLFSDMRVVSAGDLRINAPVSSDPIGMLANAFNFTVGRFRRFVQRTKGTAEQIDVIARQEIERAETFAQSIQLPKLPSMPDSRTNSVSRTDALSLMPDVTEQQNFAVVVQLQQTRERLQMLSSEGITRHTRAVAALADQISASIKRLNRSMVTQGEPFSRNVTGDLIGMHMKELSMLETVLARMVLELQNVQKNTVKGFQDLDTDLSHLATAIRALQKTTGDLSPAGEVSRETMSEIVRQNMAFANDIVALARQLGTLAQEIRTGIVSFQLDTVDSASHIPISMANINTFTGDLSQQKPQQPSIPGIRTSSLVHEQRH